MDKNEILLKAQQEGAAGVDEGTKYYQNRAHIYSRIGVDVIFCVIALASLFTGTDIPTEAYAMFLAGVCGDMYALWRNNGKRFYLFFAILMAVTVVLNLVLTVRRMMSAA